jgi:hypothetical protein
VAKGRKPAIGGLARPQGFLDDVVYPIAQKAARKVGNVSFTSNLPRNARTKITRAAKEIEGRASSRRGTSYVNKMDKAYGKMEIAIEEGRDAAARRNAGKVVLNQKKLAAKNTPNASVRRAAKAQRARNRFQTKIEKGRR